MAFIRDNHVKIIWCESVKSAYKALDARNNNFLAVAFIFCDFKPNGAVVVFCWLTNQLLPMREDENAPLPGNVGKNTCLSESGCQITQIRAWRLLFDNVKTLLLVGSQLHDSSSSRLSRTSAASSRMMCASFLV